MKVLILLATFFILGTMATHAQSTKEKLEKVKADPKTKERAAKADVYIVKSSAAIADSSSIKTTAKSSANTNSKKKKKKA